MVWGGISRDGRIDFYVLERGIMMGVWYWDEIFDVYVRFYVGVVGFEFILMDDNVCFYCVRVVEQYFQQEIIVCMDWLVCLLDLNLIEYVWNMLQVVFLCCRV